MPRLPDGVDKDRRKIMTPGNVLTALGMLGAMAVSYATLSADNADTKRRVQHLEAGEVKTHQLIKENASDIKREVSETKNNVEIILRELRSMQAVDREREIARMRDEAERRRAARP